MRELQKYIGELQGGYGGLPCWALNVGKAIN